MDLLQKKKEEENNNSSCPANHFRFVTFAAGRSWYAVWQGNCQQRTFYTRLAMS